MFTNTWSDEGIIHGTLNWVVASESQKANKYFTLYKESRLGNPSFAVYRTNDYMTNPRTRPAFSYMIVKQAGTSSNIANLGNSPNSSPEKKPARKMAGFYRIKGLMDKNGKKHDVYVEIKDYPDRNDPRKSEITASIVGDSYGLGTGGKLFSGTVYQDNISLVIDVIYEQPNKRSNLSNGRIVWIKSEMVMNAPKFNYRMEKVTKAVAEREGNKVVPSTQKRRTPPISKRN